MKTTREVPPNITLVCEWLMRKTVQIVFRSDQGVLRGGLKIVQFAEDFEFFEADDIDVTGMGDGWGPFLVDVAMEWVGMKDGWLYPHHSSITKEGKRMWTIYYDDNKRQDVERLPITDEDIIAGLKIKHMEPSLRCFYRKSSTTIIDTLVTLGQWGDTTATGH